MDGATPASAFSSSLYQLGNQEVWTPGFFNAWAGTASTVLYQFNFAPSTPYPLGTWQITAKIAITGSPFFMSIGVGNTTNFTDDFTFSITQSGIYLCNLSATIPVQSSQSIFICVQASLVGFVLQAFSRIKITRLA